MTQPLCTDQQIISRCKSDTSCVQNCSELSLKLLNIGCDIDRGLEALWARRTISKRACLTIQRSSHCEIICKQAW